MDNGYTEATGLISALFNVTSSEEAFLPTTAVPILASWLYQSLRLFSIPLSTTTKMTIYGMHIMALVQNLASAELAVALLTLFIAWNVTQIDSI